MALSRRLISACWIAAASNNGAPSSGPARCSLSAPGLSPGGKDSLETCDSVGTRCGLSWPTGRAALPEASGSPVARRPAVLEKVISFSPGGDVAQFTREQARAPFLL